MKGTAPDRAGDAMTNRVKKIVLAALVALPFGCGMAQAGSVLLQAQYSAPSSNTIVRPKHNATRLDAQAVIAILRSQGYSEFRSINQSSDTWRVRAVRNNGAIHDLVVNAFDGTILSARQAGWTKVPVPGF